MANLGIIMTGLTGNLNGSLGVIERLQKEGHNITCFAVLDIKEKIEKQGLKYVQLPPINFWFSHADSEYLKSTSRIKRLLYNLKNSSRLHKNGRTILNLDQYEAILSKSELDGILIDQELHDLIFVCYGLGIPITLLSSWFSNRMGNGLVLPPLRTDIIPGQGFKGSKFNILIQWLFIKLKVRARIFINKINFNDYRRAVLKKYAITKGFPFHTVVASNLPHLFSYTNLPILSLNIKALDFPHKTNQNFNYVGSMVAQRREGYLSAELEHFLEKIFSDKTKTGKKLIYFSASSLLQPNKEFIFNLAKAVQHQKDWICLMSLGNNTSINSKDFTQDNLYVLPWVPQIKVLEHADCCVTPAGINSINECIVAGVPMLLYSLKVADQNGCAARMHYHGIGIMADKDIDGPQAIHDNIEEILQNSSYTEKAIFFQNKYFEYRQRDITSLLNLHQPQKK